jgi:transcriptional regulator with XRE-family HTH domain
VARAKIRKAGPPPSRVFGEQVRGVRTRKGWTSQQHLADRLEELGHDIDRSAIARLETGKRGVPLDEAFAIAAALEVSPLSLMLPREPDDPVAVAPRLTVSAEEAREWVRGDEPLPNQDRQFFEQESPAFWIEVLAWRRIQALYALVHRLAEAWDQEDAKRVSGALDAIDEELQRQREELKRMIRQQRGRRDQG